MPYECPMQNAISFVGIFVMLGLAYALSENRKKIDGRLILKGLILQFVLAIGVLWTTPGRMLFEGANRAILKLMHFSNTGAAMVFGEKYTDHFFAFSVLPSIIFLSSMMAVLFYLGLMQKIVGAFSWMMNRTLMVSGAESMAASANIFVGGVEATFTIRPYLETMTRSELMTICTAGMGTIAGGVMAAYAGLGIDAGHLLAAQIISAVGSILIAKIMIPETQTPKTLGSVKIEIKKTDVNVFDAACRGAMDGIKVAAVIAALLIAFVALTSLMNYGLQKLPSVAGADLSIERILGWIFIPIVFFTGADLKDCTALSMLLGKKMFLNEFLAYLDLKTIKETLSPRSVTIATYFLCGFANFSVIAMQIGGLSSLIPTRRADIAGLGLKCMLGGTLTSLLSACIAGVLI